LPSAFDLDDLDACPHRRRTADGPPQLRVRQPEHVAQRGILIRVRRRALHIEAEAVAIERDRLVEIADDRAEEIAGTNNETGGFRRLRADERCGGQHGDGNRQLFHNVPKVTTTDHFGRYSTPKASSTFPGRPTMPP